MARKPKRPARDPDANVRRVVRLLMARDGVRHAQDLAEALGWNRNTLYGKLNGTKGYYPAFTPSEIMELADHFHVTANDLLDPSDDFRVHLHHIETYRYKSRLSGMVPA